MNKGIQFIATQEFLRDGYYAALFIILPFISKELGFSLSQAGLLQAITGSVALLIALPINLLSEKVSGSKLISLGLLIYGLAFLGLPFVTSYSQLFALYLLAGLGFSLYATLVSGLLAALTEVKNRGQLLGIVMAIGDIGKMSLSFGVPLFIGIWSWRFVGFSLGFFAVCVFSLSWFLVGKVKTIHLRKKITKPISFKELLQHKRYLQTVLASVIDAFASHPLFVLLPFLLVSKNYELTYVGIFTAIYYFGNIVSRIFFGKLADHFGSANTFIVCEILMVAMIIGLVISTTPLLIGIACICLGLVSEGSDPAIQAMTAESVQAEGSFEKAFGLKSTLNNIARTTSPLLLGFVADTFSLNAAFYVMALFILVAIIPAVMFQRSKLSR